MRIVVGTDTVSSQSTVSTYVEVNRTWNDGDVVTVLLPMHNSVEPMPNLPSYVAILHGPIVLGAKTGTESLTGLVADDGRWSHIAGGPMLDLAQAPMLAAKVDSIPGRLVPVAGAPLTFKAPFLFAAKKDTSLLFEPFYKIHDSRYMMYWMLMTDQKTLDSLSAAQQAALLLEGRTIDRLVPGQQQPEVDHQMVQSNSTAGLSQGESNRSAGTCTGGTGGSISYTMDTKGEADLSLMVRYWGNETTCTRTFDILVDGQKLVTENIVNKWKVNAFVNQEYALPNSLVAGKKTVVVVFQAATGTIGGLYGVRILRKTPLVEVRRRGVPSDKPLLKTVGGKLVVDLRKSSTQPTTVLVHGIDGSLLRSIVLPTGTISREIRGVYGVVSVQVLQGDRLILASVAYLPL